MNKAPVITLTTDFGLNSGYVASIKGVILSINPKANIIDICHSIKAQNIQEASFVIKTVLHYFPKNSIHLIVVDPDVGSGRKAIILGTNDAYFLSPDNGVLTYIVDELIPQNERTKANDTVTGKRVKIPSQYRVVEINNSAYWLKNVSSTFQGRDIFAPVAAHLSMGIPIENFGSVTTNIKVFKLHKPKRTIEGVYGEIIYVDSFGNLITNLTLADIGDRNIKLLVGGKTIKGLSKFYAQKKGLMALIGSSGYLEIVLHNGNAAEFLCIGVGSKVISSIF